MTEEKKEDNASALWVPRTELGREVFEGIVTDIAEVFESGRKIKEPEIVDRLLPNLESDIILIGGSPGKGGGIRRTPTHRTARMHRSGRRFTVSAMVVVGNRNGYAGVGVASANDNKIAIEKALENAKLNIIPIKRGCGSWECGCGENHSIPFSVEGKCGSIKIVLKPAPKGVGLCVSDEVKKFMRLAGIQDIWCKTYGNTGARKNLLFAVYDAFKNMNKTKTGEKDEKNSSNKS